MIKYILCALLGYFAGCFSPSYLLSRRRGFDIRTFGSGNAGATNMMLAAGLKPGLVVMALDVSKAFAVTLPLRLLLPPLCAALAGLFCVLGHIFPVFLRFRGGKGTACLCGTVLGLTPELVLPLLALMFVIGMIWNRASILPLLTAFWWGKLVAFFGATFFLASDGVLCDMLFVKKAEPTQQNFVVMCTYILAQTLLAIGFAACP